MRGRIGENTNVWLYAGHGAGREYKFAPLPHVNPKGWVDARRFPEHRYHPWRANCAGEPMVFAHPFSGGGGAGAGKSRARYAGEPIVFAHPHFWRERRLGREEPIMVDSNCDEVELKVGENSYGVLKPAAANSHTVTFEGVTIMRGALVGPPLCESGIARETSWLGTMYIDAPVSNLVRSANRPGWIGVPAAIPERKTPRSLEP